MSRPWVSLQAIQNMGNRSISSSNRCTLRSCRRTLTTASTTPFRSKISSHVPQRQPHRHRYTPKPSRRHHEHPSRQRQHHPPTPHPDQPDHTGQPGESGESGDPPALFTGRGFTVDGQLLPDSATEAYLCDCTLQRAFRSGSVVLDYGRAVRTIPTPLQRAVLTRDGRCRYPDATGPAHTATPTPPSAPPKQESTRSGARRRGDPADRLRRSRDGRRLRCRIVAG